MQSAKTNLNVEQVFFSIARDIKQRLSETDSKPEVERIFSHLTRAIRFVRGLINHEFVAGPDNQDQQTRAGSRRGYCSHKISVLWVLRCRLGQFVWIWLQLITNLHVIGNNWCYRYNGHMVGACNFLLHWVFDWWTYLTILSPFGIENLQLLFCCETCIRM